MSDGAELVGDAELAHAAHDEPMLRWFQHEHLPDGPLRATSRGFSALALAIAALPRCAERTVALRKLLEAKDAAVRSALLVIAPPPSD